MSEKEYCERYERLNALSILFYCLVFIFAVIVVFVVVSLDLHEDALINSLCIICLSVSFALSIICSISSYKKTELAIIKYESNKEKRI